MHFGFLKRWHIREDRHSDELPRIYRTILMLKQKVLQQQKRMSFVSKVYSKEHSEPTTKYT